MLKSEVGLWTLINLLLYKHHQVILQHKVNVLSDVMTGTFS